MKTYDVVIVGAGPAGLAAAIAACRSKAKVAMIDDNQTPGGQIWRNGLPSEMFRRYVASGVELIRGARVIDGNPRRKQLTVEADEAFPVGYSKLILATGARELFLPFPGWTLPGVVGAGGLQALAKSGLTVESKRIIVAGTGPLLPAVAAYLTQHGARVPLIAEQASWRSVRSFGGSLLRHPAKIRQALEIKRAIPGTSYLPNSWVTGASGRSRLEEVTIHENGREVRERCDYLAIGYGFVPNTELPELMECDVHNGLVVVDAEQQTTVPDIYCAGEPTGLGGVDEALLEGEIAGCEATGQAARSDRTKAAQFSEALKRCFALRPELRAAVTPETIVCRCEDVTFGRLREGRSWREAKLHFRCGMGPCQGRVCGPAVEYLMGWKTDSVRPPIFPARLQSLIETEEITQP